MGPMMHTVVDIGFQYVQKLPWTKEKQGVQTFTPDRAEEPFTDCVGVRGSNRGSEDFDVCSSSHPHELGAKLAVSVVDQVLGTLAEGCHLAELLGCPGVGWRIRHTDMNHLARAQFDDEKGEVLPKHEINHGQEISSPDNLSMLMEEEPPSLSLRTTRSHLTPVLLAAEIKRGVGSSGFGGGDRRSH